MIGVVVLTLKLTGATRVFALACVIAAIPLTQAVAASNSALSDKPVAPLTAEEVAKKKAAKPKVDADKAAQHKSDKKQHEAAKKGGGHHSSALSEEPIPVKNEEDLPKRAGMLVEAWEPFLAPGNIKPGFTIPTGAVWQPALWIFGGYRVTAGHFDNGVVPGRQFLSNRLDLFANLRLTPTERVLLGISPLSRHRTEHTGVFRSDPTGWQFVNGFNANIETLFFEGDFGELFPNLDPNDSKALDYGFSIGRQPIFFQEGMMINDSLDAIALTRDSISIPGITPDLRITGLAGLRDVHRDNNVLDSSAYVLGIFTEIDLRKSTVNVDGAYVISGSASGSDSIHLGASSVQRIFGDINAAVRVNASIPVSNTGPNVSDGVLLFTELSKTVTGTEDIVYANGFWGINEFSSAARDRGAGGPLGNTGILFAAPQASLSGSPLSNRAQNVVGGSIGYQKFLNHGKTQLVFEVGGRKDTNKVNEGAVAFGGQLLHALNNRTSLQVDAFISDGQNRTFGTGIRSEIRVRF